MKLSPAIRFALMVALVVGGLVVAYQLGLIDWLSEGSLQDKVLGLRGRWWTPLAILGLFVVAGCVPIPATAPVLIAGAVYGPWRGWLLNWFGCMLAALVGHALARALGRDFVARILGRERSAKLDKLVGEHGFWAMVRARFMAPLSVVNYAGALAGMRSLPFLLSSIVGMTIPIGIYTYVGHLLVTATGSDQERALRNSGLIVLSLLAISLVGPEIRWWRRRSNATP